MCQTRWTKLIILTFHIHPSLFTFSEGFREAPSRRGERKRGGHFMLLSIVYGLWNRHLSIIPAGYLDDGWDWAGELIQRCDWSNSSSSDSWYARALAARFCLQLLTWVLHLHDWIHRRYQLFCAVWRQIIPLPMFECVSATQNSNAI